MKYICTLLLFFLSVWTSSNIDHVFSKYVTHCKPRGIMYLGEMNGYWDDFWWMNFILWEYILLANVRHFREDLILQNENKYWLNIEHFCEGLIFLQNSPKLKTTRKKVCWQYTTCHKTWIFLLRKETEEKKPTRVAILWWDCSSIGSSIN